VLVFIAGIGENSDGVRASGCQGLEGLGVTLSPKRNRPATRRRRAKEICIWKGA
jgi:acetate kinase